MIHEAQFAVRKKRQIPAPRLAASQQPVDANLALRGETLGVREIKPEGLIKEFGDDRVREQIANLERRAASKSLRAVDNPLSYLRSLLRNKTEPAASKERGGNPEHHRAARGRGAARCRRGQSPKSSALGSSDWLLEQIEAMKKEVAALDPAKLNHWVNRALQGLARKGVLNAVISRRAAQSDVQTGGGRRPDRGCGDLRRRGEIETGRAHRPGRA